MNGRPTLRRLFLALSAAIVSANSEGATQDGAGPRTVLLLPPKEGNPRNSEGDFIRLKDGRVLFVYTHFTGGDRDKSQAHLAGRYSSDGGKTWTSKDEVIVKNEGGENTMSVSLVRLAGGEIALFYLRKNSSEDCHAYVRLSKDEAGSWSDPVLCMKEPGWFGVANNRVVQLKSGRIAIPASRQIGPDGKWRHRGTVLCFLSDDLGRTWSRSRTELQGPPERDSGLQEPLIAELKDGSLLMLCRTDLGCQYRSISKDGGESWSPVEPSNVISPLSPAVIERIPKTGDLLLVWNDHTGVDETLYEKKKAPFYGNRTPLKVAVSRDEGRTWERVRAVEDDPKGWYAYPAVEFVEDRVLLAYCAQGANEERRLRTLRITAFDLAWLYR